MPDQNVIHGAPDVVRSIPKDLLGYLDGKHLKTRIGEAISVSTMDETGWPHAALLSVGEVLALDSTHVNLCIWKKSHSAENIVRTGQISLCLVHDKAYWEIHLKAAPAAISTDERLAFFTAVVDMVRVHRVEYADVTSNTSYRLHDKDKVLKRWETQIEELRSCGRAGG